MANWIASSTHHRSAAVPSLAGPATKVAKVKEEVDETRAHMRVRRAAAGSSTRNRIYRAFKVTRAINEGDSGTLSCTAAGALLFLAKQIDAQEEYGRSLLTMRH
jgi:hypothetical protein